MGCCLHRLIGEGLAGETILEQRSGGQTSGTSGLFQPQGPGSREPRSPHLLSLHSQDGAVEQEWGFQTERTLGVGQVMNVGSRQVQHTGRGTN